MFCLNLRKVSIKAIKSRHQKTTTGYKTIKITFKFKFIKPEFCSESFIICNDLTLQTNMD